MRELGRSGERVTIDKCELDGTDHTRRHTPEALRGPPRVIEHRVVATTGPHSTVAGTVWKPSRTA